MITVTWNKDLFLGILFILMFVNSIIKMVQGAWGGERPRYYDWTDFADGMIGLMIVFLVLLVG